VKRLHAVYGASGCGRGVMPLLRAQCANDPSARLVFVDDAPPAARVNGHPVWDWQRFLDEPAIERRAVIAIADPALRARLDARCRAAGVRMVGTRAANVVIMDAVEIGEDAVLSPFVALTSNIRIGRGFHANLHASVEHDCVIGDFVTLAPGARCNGNTIVGDHAWIGAGAVIRQGTPDRPLRIGRGAIVGMGAVVTRDVPAGATVAGNPARPLPRGKPC
jgi:sugar O-acyltransferase (sialic acid O-acetyltransferase NeuD family)